MDKDDPQDLCCDKTGNVFMCFPNGWISRLTPDHRVKDIVNTKPLFPYSLCVTQSCDILVALVDVSMQDLKQTYIARLDSLGREKQRIQFEEDGKTRLFQHSTYVFHFNLSFNRDFRIFLFNSTAPDNNTSWERASRLLHI